MNQRIQKQNIREKYWRYSLYVILLGLGTVIFVELIPFLNKKERSYWSMLDAQMRQFCQEEGLLYVRDDDSIKRPFNDPPIVVNYFFHEEIIPRPKCRRTGNQNYIVTCRKLEVVEVRL